MRLVGKGPEMLLSFRRKVKVEIFGMTFASIVPGILPEMPLPDSHRVKTPPVEGKLQPEQKSSGMDPVNLLLSKRSLTFNGGLVDGS